ncbi:MAG: hypothetical protein JW850_08435 [Thermoflexales bacterium]|nr:hypothetical protein [Thermoflexales bacterium]
MNSDAQPSAGPVARLLNLETLWLLVVPLGLLGLLNLTVQIHPNDFWWHVRLGQIILDEGHIPSLDRFSFTRAGQPWVNQAWLMQVALYLLYRAGGLPLLILAHSLCISAGYALLVRSVTRYHGLRTGVLAALLGTALGVLNWLVRPQTISFLFFGLLVYLVEAHRHGQTRRLWWVVPLFAVWVNCHGGFVFGLAALGLYVVGRLWEFWLSPFLNGAAPERRPALQMAGVGLLACVALALNPQGPLGILQYVLGFVQNSTTTQHNLEFLPLTIRQLDGALFFAVSVLLVVALAAAYGRTGPGGFRLHTDQVLSLLVFGALALLARRNAPWYGFVLTPCLAAALHAWWDRPYPLYAGKAWLNGLILGLVCLLVLLALPWWRAALPLPADKRQLLSPGTPVAAAEYLRQHPGGRLFNEMGYGSYLIWALPEQPVFIDPRVELYPPEQWRDYLKINSGARYNELLAKYGLDRVMLDVQLQADLALSLVSDPLWRKEYEDRRTQIWSFLSTKGTKDH